jgi:PIN domain nuclease of toxin-antitoxin system
MKLLVDTHALIWFVENDINLPAKIKEQIENNENEILISIASLWEMAIKTSVGKLEISTDIQSVIQKIEENGFILFPILPEHIVCVSTLSLHHKDPFDRMIIAQSFTEKIPVVSKDDLFDGYEIDRIW